MKRIMSAAAVAFLVAGGVAAPAQGTPTYDPEKEKPATPGQACRAVQNIIDALAPDAGVEFSVGECASALAKRDFTLSFFGTPVQEQCAMLEGFGIEWPYTFYEEEVGTIDDLLPELTARNSKECTHALYTYHTIVTLVPEPPG